MAAGLNEAPESAMCFAQFSILEFVGDP